MHFKSVKSKKTLFVIVGLMLVVSLVLAGCNAGGAKPDAGGAAPVKEIKWKLATSWSTGIPLYTDMAQYFAQEVDKLSNGRLKIEVFPGGAIAPALEVSEAVKSGVADAGHLWPGYDLGKDRTSALFGGFGGSGTSEEMVHWLYQGGGAELWKQWRQEKFGIIGMPLGVRPQEAFLHSNKPVKTLEDLKGLKVRTVGAWAEILPGLGASVVTLPGDEVLPALERKVIDATEWASPGEDLVMGFEDVSKYVIVPGVHQPSAPFELVINQKSWDALTPDLQAIVEAAAKTATLMGWTKLGANDTVAMEKYKAAGHEVVTLDSSVKEAALKLSNDWADKNAKDNEWFAKVLKSQRDFSAKWANVKANR